MTLDRPLVRGHDYGAPVQDVVATKSGNQGDPAPNQRFGGVLSPTAGSIALVDPSGTVVDAIVHGSQQSNSSGNGTIASPELATLEGDQSGGGCIAIARRPAGVSGFSLGRYPDGADSDSNCKDFHVQAVATLAMASAAGITNIKVSDVEGFRAGQNILIDTGANGETATIAAVGTPGAATTESATGAGATMIPVANPFSFRAGQTITIGEGADQEMATVAAGGRRGAPMILIESPLKYAHPAGSQVSGSGITMTSALTRAHASGSQVADNLPTPGAPNKYAW
jgi:non-reducing end alpha-L-arabinofuranosidase